MADETEQMMRALFESIALRTAGIKGAAKLRLEHDEFYLVCPGAFMSTTPTDDERQLPLNIAQQFSYEIPQVLKISSVNNVKPEVRLEAARVPLNPNIVEWLVNNKGCLVPCPKGLLDGEPAFAVCCNDDDGCYAHLKIHSQITYNIIENALFQNLRVCRLSLPHELADVYKHMKVKYSLGLVKLTGVPVIILRSGGSILCIALIQHQKLEDLTRIRHDKRVWVPDGWDDKTKTWKHFITERKAKMAKGLPSPVTTKRNAKGLASAVNSAVASVQQSPTVAAATLAGPADENDQEVNDAATATASVAAKHAATQIEQVSKTVEDKLPDPPAEIEVPDALAAQTAELMANPAPAAPEPVEEPAAAEVNPDAAAPKRKRQTRPAAKLGFDFTKVQEYLSAPVEELTADAFDKVLEEIRALRDLQIAAARRSANLSTEVHKMSASAVQKIAALKAMF